jgi:hypothetical protein
MFFWIFWEAQHPSTTVLALTTDKRLGMAAVNISDEYTIPYSYLLETNAHYQYSLSVMGTKLLHDHIQNI